MFKLTCYLLILFPIIASSAEPEERLVCSDCRSSVNDKVDYGNFVYNRTFGWDSMPGMIAHIGNGGIVRVINLAGDHALVDIDIVTEPFTFNIFNFAIFQITSVTSKLNITVQSPDGKQFSYEVFANSGRLQVGEETGQSVIEAWGEGQQRNAYSGMYGAASSGRGGIGTFIGGYYYNGSAKSGVVRITECDGGCKQTD